MKFRSNFLTLLCLVVVCMCVDRWEDSEDIHYTNSWAVHIEDGDSEVANRIAKRHGFVNLGQVGSLPGYYHFVHKPVARRRKRRDVDKKELLLTEKEVKWVEQQQLLERDKRSIIPDFVAIEHPKSIIVQDPLFKEQWYLNNIGQSSGPPDLDINVLPVWSKGITGRGVIVAVLDDGLDYTHPDLVKNYDSKASYDFNDYDNDPMPRTSDPTNCHGTKCAGEVAAESGNGICGVGVAFNSSIGGIRMLDGNTTDTIEGSSLSYRNNYIHIYSCAWGPKDDGKRFGRPGTLASKALFLGTKEGRGGLGSIFVWATGNGGLTDDDCNCDGYTTSIFTISIGAISDHGLSTYYTESCASTLAVTYSGGSHREKRENKVITTTLNHKCTDQFKGTSSAAPLAAGMIALMLEANPKLTWRDVQSVIVETALMTSPLDEGWRRNGAGKWFNQKFGFGRMDASQLVNKAKNWDSIPEQRKCWGNKNDGPWKIPESGTLLVPNNASACSGTALEIRSLEHVQLVISLKHRHRGHLSIELISPSGTRSQILKTRRNDHSNKGLKDWIFMSVHFWGEDPRGIWTLAINDNSNNNRRHYRAKVKHGDLEDATEALQDELLGRPRPQEDDSEGPSQAHEGVLDKPKHNAGTELSEDFEGGIFESKSYRSSRKHSKKKKRGKRRKKSKQKKRKKEKERHRKHHKHHYSHKKSKPTVKTKEIQPTFMGKTFDALTKNKQGQFQPFPTQPRHAPMQSSLAQNNYPFANSNNSRNGNAAAEGTSQGAAFQDATQFHIPKSGQEPGSQNSLLGGSPDQSLTPTTRHNFETTAANPQHDLIQGLVKSVLSELFTALRARRNESLLGDVSSGYHSKINATEPMDNVSTSMTKAWRNEKGVQKINSLISILDKVKGVNAVRGNGTDANDTRADEMLSDVLKVLRDILSASKTDDKTKEFKLRVAKLIGDSSNDTRNLTQKLFDDMQLRDDGNRTSLVINDALSLISHIFQDDTQKKKIAESQESALGGGVIGPIGIILRRPDGSLIIPNPNEAGLQVQGGGSNIIRSWNNASQIETVRIEHTKVTPVNIASIAPKQMEPRAGNKTIENAKVPSGDEGKSTGKQSIGEGDGDIEMEVERSGDGKPNVFSVLDNDNDNKDGRNTGAKTESTVPGSIINMRKMEDGENEQLKIGNTASRVGPVRARFAGDDKGIHSESRKLDMEEHGDVKPHTINKVTEQEIAGQDRANANSDHANSDDQIDVTVFFDKNSDKEFINEVNALKAKRKNIKHGKFSSKNNLDAIEDFEVQKSGKKFRRKPVLKNRQFLHLPMGPAIQSSNVDEDSAVTGNAEEEEEEEDASRSKGEIPDGDSEESDEGEAPATGMYDMRDSLPFFSVPVSDQHGYSLLAPFFDPYHESPYPPGFDLVGGDEQAPLIEEDSDFYEPQSYKHEWKRSLPDSLLVDRKLPATASQLTRRFAPFRKTGALIRRRRGIPEQTYIQDARKLSAGSRPSTMVKSKRSTDIASARSRFAELLRKIHERSAWRQGRLALEDLPVASHFARHVILPEHLQLLKQASRHRPRRSLVLSEAEHRHSLIPANAHRAFESHGDRHRTRRRRSVDGIGPGESQKNNRDVDSESANVPVYREKRDKIIEDCDDNEDNDFENEPHVVKRSAIFGDLDSSQSGESRSKRQTDDTDEEYDDDSEGERKETMPQRRRVSSLEETLRKKLLSMKTQSQSVFKLLKRVHEDIARGNTQDLFKLEAEIAAIEKREATREKLGEGVGKIERKLINSKSNKKVAKHRHINEVYENSKAKSVTSETTRRAAESSKGSSSDEDSVDNAEMQEKLAYKNNPDEYLKYGAGNTGVLESWTLVFYGT